MAPPRLPGLTRTSSSQKDVKIGSHITDINITGVVGSGSFTGVPILGDGYSAYEQFKFTFTSPTAFDCVRGSISKGFLSIGSGATG